LLTEQLLCLRTKLWQARALACHSEQGDRSLVVANGRGAGGRLQVTNARVQQVPALTASDNLLLHFQTPLEKLLRLRAVILSRIFISHSSENNAEAVALCDWLESEGWKDEVFLDLDATSGIAAGEHWERKLNEAANRCEAVLFLVSKAWLGSDWCGNELNLARRLNKRLFGILIEDLPKEDVPSNLSDEWQTISLASGIDGVTLPALIPITHEVISVTFSQEGLQRLKHGLEQAGLDPEHFAWPPASDPTRPPYRGLRPLEPDDAGIFFGRDAPVIEALDRLRGLRETTPPRLLVILGASGAGKSSFLRAGLLPRLMRDDRHFLPLPVIRPERAAITGKDGLLNALEAAFQAAKIPAKRADLRAAIEGETAKLRPLLQSLVEAATPAALDPDLRAKPPTLVVSIDQGEELFLAEGQDEAGALLALLQDLLTDDAPALIVLFTIRSDSYERLQEAKPLEGIRKLPFDLGPLPKGSYAEVIKGPVLRLAGTERKLEIEESLVNALLTDIDEGGAKDALPLLAFTLERLYLEYGGGGQLTLADYEALGRIKGSIEAAVEHAFAAADNDAAIPNDRNARLALLRRGLIPWLAGIDPDTGSPRQRVARQSEIPEEARPLINHLVDQRLLATDIAKQTGEQTIEPVHEALLRQWGLLQGWLAEDAGLLGVLEGVKRASRDWAANNNDAGWLTHGANRLQAAERLHDRPDLAASLEQTDWDYLSACREREDASIVEAKAARNRKRRFELAFMGVLIVISVAGTAYALGKNFDYLKARGEMIADSFWPKTLTPETERTYAQMILRPGQIISFRECSRCPEMVVVPKGEFLMGSPKTEKNRTKAEEPQHKVTIASNFAVSKFEETFDEWKACVDARVCEDAPDQRWGRGNRPVINVSWDDAQQYVQWLSERTGRPYRLLSEAEWEYAARAGSRTAFSWGDNIGEGNANCDGCGSTWDNKQTAPVGSFKANAFGLHDMHGNVFEWVQDCGSANYDGAPTDGSAKTDGTCIPCSARRFLELPSAGPPLGAPPPRQWSEQLPRLPGRKDVFYGALNHCIFTSGQGEALVDFGRYEDS
jgi:formylglycine-generating enzyme required for sulfatase activity